jgi:uncharacterized circularly permuted ATP-grasp superfamily protein
LLRIGPLDYNQTSNFPELRARLSELAASGNFEAATKSLHASLVSKGMTFEGKKYSYNPSPLLISHADALAICSKSSALARVLDKVGEMYVKMREVREFFGTYASLEELTMVDVPYRPIAHLNRFDTVWLGGSRFKVLEPNCCCPAGVTSNALTRQAWQSVPAFRDLTSGFDVIDFPIDDLSTFAKSLCGMARNYGHSDTVALANYNGSFTFELDHIVDSFQNLGCKAVIADLSEFSFRDGSLMVGGERVGLVYNKLDQLMFRQGFKHLDYFAAYAKQAFLSINSFRAQIILEDKAVLALLHDTDFNGLFDVEERRLIADHIPWTAYVRDRITTHPTEGSINLLDYARVEQDGLVLKPTNETRGAGVTIGRSVTREIWARLLDNAVDGDWIVQEFCELPVSPTICPGDDGRFVVRDWQYSLDIFMLGGNPIGLTSRSNEGNIINVGSGGMRRPVCVVA